MTAPAADLAAWASTPAAMRGWAATARAGEEMVYAHGRVDRRCPAAAFARVLERRRNVILLQRRRGAKVDYLMRRLRPSKASIGRENASSATRLDGDMARLLRVLRGLARDALPCPSNRALAKLAGIGTADQASYVLRKLIAAGRVASQVWDEATGKRIVTILSTGRETAVPEARR